MMKQVLLLIISPCLIINALAQDFYCRDKPQDLYILTNRYQRIITTREGDQHYPHNATCEYPIETLDSHRIKLTVELSHLYQPSHFAKSYCEAYDHVDIFDGEGKKLITWCGREYPKEIISSGNALKVVFKSNKVNAFGGLFRGVQIRIQIFANTTCPPGWLEFNNSCYSTTVAKHSWEASQIECNQRQSNLLTIDVKGSLTFLFKEILNKSSEMYMWTGLNGVVGQDQLLWVDKSSPKRISGFVIPEWNDRKRCGMIHTKQALIYLQDCHHRNMYALCQSRKNAVTQLYPTKVSDLSYGVAESDNSGQILLGVCIPIIILVLLAAVIFVVMNHLGVSVSCPSCTSSARNDWQERRDEDLEPEQLPTFTPGASVEI